MTHPSRFLEGGFAACCGALHAALALLMKILEQGRDRAGSRVESSLERQSTSRETSLISLGLPQDRRVVPFRTFGSYLRRADGKSKVQWVFLRGDDSPVLSFLLVCGSTNGRSSCPCIAGKMCSFTCCMLGCAARSHRTLDENSRAREGCVGVANQVLVVMMSPPTPPL